MVVETYMMLMAAAMLGAQHVIMTDLPYALHSAREAVARPGRGPGTSCGREGARGVREGPLLTTGTGGGGA